jgi:GUN4-like
MKNLKKNVIYFFYLSIFLAIILAMYSLLSEIRTKYKIDIELVELDKHLISSNYIQADIITAELLGDIVKYELNRKSFLSYELDFLGDARVRKIRSEISCESLTRIDSLWSQYSFGKFGFQSQTDEFKKILAQKNITFNEYHKISKKDTTPSKYWGWNKYIEFNNHAWHWTIKTTPNNVLKGFFPSNLWLVSNSPKHVEDISFILEKYESCNKK